MFRRFEKTFAGLLTLSFCLPVIFVRWGWSLARLLVLEIAVETVENNIAYMNFDRGVLVTLASVLFLTASRGLVLCHV